MAKKISIDETYLQDILVQLLNIPSPTGYTEAAPAGSPPTSILSVRW
jgi:hypothetical protein